MSRFLLIALFIFPLVLPITACWEEEGGADYSSDYENLYVQTSDGPRHMFTVSIADTEEKQAEGLMHWTELAQDAGMLFVFADDAERSFWMKNTLIPLDIIFIRVDGKIHHIHENAIPEDLTSISSQGPVSAVLEINGGLAEKLGIKPGDIVQHRYFAHNLAQ